MNDIDQADLLFITLKYGIDFANATRIPVSAIPNRVVLEYLADEDVFYTNFIFGSEESRVKFIKRMIKYERRGQDLS